MQTFACSTGPVYEEDVERFVRHRLRGHFEWRKDHLGTSIVLLSSADDDEDILAIGAHELDDQRTEEGEYVEGTYLIVGAVRVDMQGVHVDMEPFEDGRPVTVGRLLAETLIDDVPERPGAVRAVVARENHRSLKLCERLGLRSEQQDSHEGFVQRLGRVAMSSE